MTLVFDQLFAWLFFRFQIFRLSMYDVLNVIHLVNDFDDEWTADATSNNLSAK